MTQDLKATEKRPKPGSRNVWLFVAVLVVFALLAIVFTRPVLFNASGKAVSAPYDPEYQSWSIAWQLRALGTKPLDLFNSNIFFPNKYTLAYSDHQFTNVILAAPVVGVTGNPMQAQNYLLIFHFFLSSLGAYLLVVHLTRNRFAGFIAGIAYAYAPYKLLHLVHLNLSSAGWIPLCLLFLHMYCEERRPRDAALCALFFLIQALTTWHYGLILGVGIAVFLLVRLVMNRKSFTLRWTLTLTLSLAVAGLLLVPFAIPYLKVQKQDPEFKRTIEDVDYFSADIQDFLAAPRENFFWGSITRGLRENTYPRGSGERTIFPGLIPLVLGIFGAVHLFGKGRGEERFSAYFYTVLAGVSTVLCLGTALYVFGRKFNLPMPYKLLYYLVPGFKAMRVPPRFAILIALSLAVLSGFGVKALIECAREKRNGLKIAGVAAVLVLALLLVDLFSIHLPMYPVPVKSRFPAVYQWLEDQEGPSPTVELPLPPVYSELWFRLENLRTYYSILHWKKLFNGYSGYVPQTYYEGYELTKESLFPSAESLEFFRNNGIELVIVHSSEMDPSVVGRMEAWTAANPDVKSAGKFGTDYVYRLERK